MSSPAAVRVFDLVVASIALAAALPVLAIAFAGIRLSSPGPFLYRARRVGRHGREFVMYKLRSMHVVNGPRALITAQRDQRVFRFGALLRAWKIDELPQLWNVLRGDMSLVGPRPEDPEIVREHYDAEAWETLEVAPGLSSPGSLFYYSVGESMLGHGSDVSARYVRDVLPMKIDLDRVYVRRASVPYNLALLARTVWMIVSIAAGRREFPPVREMAEARQLRAAATKSCKESA